MIYSFETSDGQKQSATGTVTQNLARASPEDPENVVVVQGEFSYPGPDGVIYTVKYTADANGFHPEVSIDSSMKNYCDFLEMNFINSILFYFSPNRVHICQLLQLFKLLSGINLER